jgi:hypothetical protein
MAQTTTLSKQDKPQHVAQGLKLVDPETASKPIADAFALLPVINVFRAMANAETLYPYFSEYMLRLFRPLELDKALERMIVLRVANQSNCFYAWRQNVVVAHSVGVKDEQIAFAFTDEVMQLIEATDQTYDAAKRHFSDRALTEILYVIGTYMLIARVIRTGRVPLDDKPAASPQ